MAISPIAIATQGTLNSPLSVAAVRGHLIIEALVADAVDGGSSDPALIAKQIAPRVVDPMLRAKLLREDEEIMQIIIAFIERLDE
jgi:hypothetical protein